MSLSEPIVAVAHHPRARLVVFTRPECTRLADIARNWQVYKAAHPEARDKRIKHYGNAAMHYIGLMGEAAVAQELGIDRDGHANMTLDEEAMLAGNRYYDFNLFGTWIEVKTLQGFLTFVSLKDFVADVAVLVIHTPGIWDRVWIQGWTTRRHFWEENFTRNFKYGDRPCMRPASLNDIGVLLGWCQMRAVMEEGLVK